ncbi:MAG: xanthine dehydrogenase family protein molybdopterin-binding subunit [Anaerolineales bacterium]|nr:xanthine dehydrogenase family protein molybdopterin-binding subunit [Chloroflexota bacterium]MBL6981854.1 xanthine dehydrogenase family protein molybdopterin-binding subunit [Anaerolineales bacterium]
MAKETITLGKSELRKDAWAKVTGAAQYVADIPHDGVLYGAIVRSTIHHGQLLSVNVSAAKEVQGVVKVITSDDIPGDKAFGALIHDQPPLVVELVRHLGEPIALVIAETEAVAKEAAELVEIEYEPIEPVHDPVDAVSPEASRLYAEGNLISHYEIKDGDIENGLAEADIVLEENFSVPLASPAYMETENAVARWNDDDTLTVWVSSQHPFIDQMEIAAVLGIEPEKVQVKSAVVGGAFGGKEDASIAILASLGAWVVKGAVKLVNTRQESFWAHPKRHPAQFQLKLGAKSDGTIVALKAKANVDTGAFASYGPAVGIILTETLAGSYHVPNVDLETIVAYTNGPLAGAVRGFGSPQSHFAIESMIDMLAAKLGMDPVEVRRKNILREGDKMFTGVVVNETANSLPESLKRAEEILKQFEAIEPEPGKVAGSGMALVMQSMGLGAKVPDDSTQGLEWLPDGSVRVHLGSPDLGQGLTMTAEQITAETLEVPYDKIKTVDIDTWESPNGNVTCASRMTYMVGNALVDAAEQLKSQMLIQAARLLNQPQENLSYQNGELRISGGEKIAVKEIVSRAADDGIELKTEATFSFPYPEETTPQHLPIGMPHVMFCFGAQIARVEVDPDLGTVAVTHMTAIHDVGRVISRQGVEGQIEGGASMGLGYALFENMTLKENDQWVDSFTEYLLPTTKDMPPEFKNIILEIPEASGPFGAKGIGEVTVPPTAPAIANAIYHATGVRVKSLPITPEKFMAINTNGT